jgi:hypothetical protein
LIATTTPAPTLPRAYEQKCSGRRGHELASAYRETRRGRETHADGRDRFCPLCACSLGVVNPIGIVDLGENGLHVRLLLACMIWPQLAVSKTGRLLRTTSSNDFFERFLRTIFSNDLFERFIRTTPPNDNLTNLTAALDITQQASINFPFHTHPASIHKRRVTYPSCVPRTPYHSFKFPLISQREQTLPASNRQPSTNGTTAWGCCAPRSKLRNARE